MPFRASFDCLWCGTPWAVRGPDDLEGFAQLCPSCVGRAGENGFLRFRLKDALAERARTAADSVAPPPPRETPRSAPPWLETPRTSAPAALEAKQDPDDFYLRRGRHEHGPIHDQAWAAELDQATLWLDGLPIRGEIVELAAGTGWWSPLLAGKGTLSIYDAAQAPLDRARERLVAHGLRAHLHVRDAWAEPDRQVDALFCGFWLSRVPDARLDQFLALARRWLKPGGTFAWIDARRDARPDPPSVLPSVATGLPRPAELEAALLRADFAAPSVVATARFFLLGCATAGIGDATAGTGG
jgi:SAM-dependent methyltransferase